MMFAPFVVGFSAGVAFAYALCAAAPLSVAGYKLCFKLNLTMAACFAAIYILVYLLAADV